MCPCQLKGLPNHLVIVQSWGYVDENRHIHFQVDNVKPGPQTMYKGTKVTEFIPSKEVMLVTEVICTLPSNCEPTLPELDLSVRSLTHPQQEALRSLLWSYRHVFAIEGDPMGTTNLVKHTIQTSTILGQYPLPPLLPSQEPPLSPKPEPCSLLLCLPDEFHCSCPDVSWMSPEAVAFLGSQ